MRLEQAACAEAAVEAAATTPGENSEAAGKAEVLLLLGLGLDMASGDGVGMEAGGVSSPADEVVVVVIEAPVEDDEAEANEAQG